MDKFWDAMNRSVLVQATVTLSVVAAVIYAELFRTGASQTLTNALWLTLGFYFGSKAGLAINNRASHS